MLFSYCLYSIDESCADGFGLSWSRRVDEEEELGKNEKKVDKMFKFIKF
jgi:hypothetical protein